MLLNDLGRLNVGLFSVLVVVPLGPVSVQSQSVILLFVFEVSLGVSVNGPQESLGSMNPALGLAYSVRSTVSACVHPESEVTVSESWYCWLLLGHCRSLNPSVGLLELLPVSVANEVNVPLVSMYQL